MRMFGPSEAIKSKPVPKQKKAKQYSPFTPASNLIPNYLLSPDGKFRWVWNLHILYASVAISLIDPLLLAYGSFVQDRMRGWLVFIDIFLLLDIVVTSMTTFKVKIGYEKRIQQVLVNYLKTNLVFDLLGNLPGIITMEKNESVLYFKVFRIFKVAQGFKFYHQLCS